MAEPLSAEDVRSILLDTFGSGREMRADEATYYAELVLATINALSTELAGARKERDELRDFLGRYDENETPRLMGRVDVLSAARHEAERAVGRLTEELEQARREVVALRRFRDHVVALLEEPCPTD